MEFRNLTPFPALAFQALDQCADLYHVVVVRQTLNIQAHGSLRYCNEQAPLVVADEYFGAINCSSVRQESDLAPYKPKCDVIVIANAYSPGGIPSRRFPVSVRILSPTRGENGPGQGAVVLDKTLIITGARSWQRTGRGRWNLSEPKLISALPVRYEYAYGGELKVPDVEGQRTAVRTSSGPTAVPPLRHSVVETNSVGRGYTESWYLDAERPSVIVAPQIEDPANPPSEFGKHYPAQGLGVITKAWVPRRTLAGTIDDAFAKSDKWLPEDFNFGYWNGAHPDMQVPFLQGDETVELTNLTPEGELRVELPGHRATVLVRYESGEIAPSPLNLDTLVIDTERMTLSIVNRVILSVQPTIRVLEARLITRDQWEKALNAHIAGSLEPTVIGASRGR